jgi:hypothetical protein
MIVPLKYDVAFVANTCLLFVKSALNMEITSRKEIEAARK